MKPTFRFSLDQRIEIETVLSGEDLGHSLMPDFVRALELETDMLRFRLFADLPKQEPGRPPRVHERDFATRVAWLFSDHLGVAPRTAHDESSSSFAAVIGVCFHAIGLRVPQDPFRLLVSAVHDVAPVPISEIYMTKAEREAIKNDNRRSKRSRRKKARPKANRRTAS